MSESPERFVFEYWDGEKHVFGDPLEINMNLVGHARGQLSRLIEASKSKGPEDAVDEWEATNEAGERRRFLSLEEAEKFGSNIVQTSKADDEVTLANKCVLRDRANSVAFPAIAKMWEVARLTFDLVPFDKTTGNGATARDCNKVLTDWFAFISGQKKSGEPSPHSAPPTEAASSDAA